LAKSLGVSKQTIDAAYDELAARRLVRTRPGRAVTVRRQLPEDPELTLPLPETRQRAHLPSKAWLGSREETAPAVDFRGAGSRLPNLTARQLKLLHEKALASSRGPLFAPPPPLGENTLRQAACRQLARCGVLRESEEVAILPSRPAAVRQLLELFVPRRGLVIADSPLDPELVVPVHERGARLVVLPPGDGEDFTRFLARRSPRLLLAATGISRLTQPPAGLARRRALLALARERGIPVLEDVTRTDRLTRPGIPPPLAVLDRGGRVLPLCDLSDELGGDFAAAVVAGPPKMLDRLRALGGGPSRPLTRLAQRALALALESPGRLRALAAVDERRTLLADSVKQTLRRRIPDLAGIVFSPGADAVRLDLPAGLDARAVRAAAAERGILLWAGHDCGATAEDGRFLLLDLTRHDEGDLLEGIRKLGRIIAEMHASPAS
jgi:DNA-binding transcriptional MocR family regulator